MFFFYKLHNDVELFEIVWAIKLGLGTCIWIDRVCESFWILIDRTPKELNKDQKQSIYWIGLCFSRFDSIVRFYWVWYILLLFFNLSIFYFVTNSKQLTMEDRKLTGSLNPKFRFSSFCVCVSQNKHLAPYYILLQGNPEVLNVFDWNFLFFGTTFGIYPIIKNH